MVDSTNPKIMAENIKALAAGAGGSGLPDVTVTDAGKVLSVSSEGTWVAGDPPKGFNLDYSLEEKDTGKTWIDGRKIYSIVIPFSDEHTISSFPEEIIFPANKTPEGMLMPIFGSLIMNAMGGNYGYYVHSGYLRKNTSNQLVVKRTGDSGNLSIYDDEVWLYVEYIKTN